MVYLICCCCVSARCWEYCEHVLDLEVPEIDEEEGWPGEGGNIRGGRGAGGGRGGAKEGKGGPG